MDKHYKDYIQIGLNIMRYRKEQGLTQDQLSEMAGYSRNHLQRVETAVCKPTVGLLLDVSEVLGVPVERLMEIRKLEERLLWQALFTSPSAVPVSAPAAVPRSARAAGRSPRG